MKLRHGVENPGTLQVGKSPGYPGTIVLTFDSPPLMPPEASAPWEGCVGALGTASTFLNNELGKYPHNGILLRNGAGAEEVLPWSSWTEALGVYTFVIPGGYALARTYLVGDYAGVYTSAKLRGNCADSNVVQALWHLNRNLRIKNYHAGYFDPSACGAPAYTFNPWDGRLTFRSFNRSTVFPTLNYFRWYHSYPTGSGSAGGYRFDDCVLTMQQSAYSWGGYAHGMRWWILVRWWAEGALGWGGVKECDSSDPAGIYTRMVGAGYGCCAPLPTIELEVEP